MADPPSENEAPPQDASVVSEDTALLGAPPQHPPHPHEQPQWQWHPPPQYPAVAAYGQPLPPGNEQGQGQPPNPAYVLYPPGTIAYYEAQMRDHAAAYASAAAGAAWAAAQIANSSSLPPALPPVPQPLAYGAYEQHQQQQPWHPPPQASEEHARPGKRQQTMPAGVAAESNRRQSPPPSRHDYRSSEKRGRRRMRSDNNSSDTSSRGRPHRKRSSDRTLLGKTGVSALHEWRDKRKLSQPQFVQQPKEEEDHVMSVMLDGQERGRGRGFSKGTAKQEAARQALQSLLPGVVFDADGILVKLPTSSSLGDLAPNLASRLAIGEESTKKRQPSSRTWDVYPGTSTTSGEEDNDYYASRGASVCSALLHALWQIDDGIPEPPSYTFDLCTAAAKRKGSVGSSAIAVHRSSFACTARLVVKRPLLSDEFCKDDNASDKKDEKNDKPTDNDEKKDQSSVETLTAVSSAATKREARHAASAKLLALLFPDCNGMVEVKAAAEAVREKYAASKALKVQSRRTVAIEKRKLGEEPDKPTRKRSIDFATPEDSDLPLPPEISNHFRNILERSNIKLEKEEKTEDNDDVVSVESLSLSEKAVPGDEKVDAVPYIEESLARSLSRKKQLDERVDNALQVMNELDEEGRSLPEELNSNDVGRTVLRRAESEDADWIEKLVANRDDKSVSSLQARVYGSTPGPLAMLGVSLPSTTLSTSEAATTSESLSLPYRLWGSSTITLLLCRAISPKDDPPLGCAVLTLGFSTDKGPSLRITELVSEPHLPKERFVECLMTFASHMNRVLETEEPSAVDGSPSLKPRESVYSTDQLRSIVESHLGRSYVAEGPTAGESSPDVKPTAASSRSGIMDLKTIGTSLQSVQEEEVEDEKDKEDDESDSPPPAPKNKPCKRSRVV